jgi:hypothetical protein
MNQCISLKIKNGIGKLSMITFIMLIFNFLCMDTALSQGVIGRAIKDKLERKVIEKTDEAIDDAFDQEKKKKADDDEEVEDEEPL